MKNKAPFVHPIALRKLVLNGYPYADELLDIVHGLASPLLHTFVCFWLAVGGVAAYDKVVEVLE